MPKIKKYTADILIIGGGVAGLTLAALLGQAGVFVHLVEPHPPESFANTSASSRTVALMQSSLNILRATGLTDFCDAYGTQMKMMRIIDDSAQGQKTLNCEFDAFDIGLEYFSMNIPNSMLRARLYEDISTNKNVTLHANTTLKDFTVENNSTVHATLDNGSHITVPLIIGADGRQSLVRSIAGIKAKQTQYNQSAITCIINHSRAHDFTSTEFHRAGGPFALVPMKGNQSSVVWVEKTPKADALIAMPKHAFEQALQKATNDILGGITLETNPQSWPLCAVKAKSIIAPRVALIAEAAHVMSPITAQGLNLSLRDVATLAEIIIDAMRVGADHGSQTILHTYAQRRSVDIDTRTFGVNKMNNLVSNDSAPIKDIRRLGLKIVDRFSPIKMIAMQHGLAPTLDMGRLTSGNPL